MPRLTVFVPAVLLAGLLRTPPVAADEDPYPPPPPPPADVPPDAAAVARVPQVLEEPRAEPAGPFPARPPTGAARTVSLALSLGPGWLALRDHQGRDGQSAFGLGGRLGVVIAPEVNLVLGLERTSTGRDGATFAQTAGILGLERFFLQRAYVGAAAALAWVAETGVPDGLTDGPGVGLTALLGVEILRSAHAALTAEAAFTIAKYDREAWEMGGLRLGVVVY
jgi:hypothetical protein